MNVEFFLNNNSDEVTAVEILAVRDGYLLRLERFNTSSSKSVTEAVVAAVRARLDKEYSLNLTPRPEMMCSYPNEEPHTRRMFFVTVAESTLEDWKVFLRDLLSKPESWMRLKPGMTSYPDAEADRVLRDLAGDWAWEQLSDAERRELEAPGT
jgi:hypothetical protein